MEEGAERFFLSEVPIVRVANPVHGKPPVEDVPVLSRR